MDLALNSNDQNKQCEETQQKSEKVPHFRVLPLFEKEAHTARAIQKYSMLNHELMAKRWRRRISLLGTEGTNKVVRDFPEISDYHFKNYRTQFNPTLSYKNFKPPQFHLTPGPGADIYGQRPIPIDMLMRKSETVKSNKLSLKKKTGITGKPKKR